MPSIKNACKLLANAIRTNTPSKRYLTYIASPQWAARRHEHLELCDYRCEMPGCSRPAIQVHHWTYANLGNENAENLSAVCVWCHWQIHRNVMPRAANDNEQLAFTFDEEKAG